MHREIEKRRPLNAAVEKIYKHYQQNPLTPAGIASHIQDLHEKADEDRTAMDEKHARELMPLLEQIREIKTKAKEMGLVHRKEKEDKTLGYAVVELDLLEGRIAKIPDEIPLIDSDSGVFLSTILKGTSWLARKFGQRHPKSVVNTPVDTKE